MKAAYYKQYGPPDTVTVIEAPKPKITKNQVLVRIENTAVTAADARIRAAQFPKGFGFLARLAFGVRKPRNHVLGSCFSGVVEAVGGNVKNLKPGDEVCGMSGIKMGAHAQYIAIDAMKSVALKPKSISHQDAAGILFGGTAALYFLRDQAKVVKNETVLVNGASGAVGTNAVQLAKYFGASVTGVTSGENAELVTSLGAKQIIDYTKENVIESANRYDVVLDAVGNINIKNGIRIINSSGRLILMVASLAEILQSSLYSRVKTGTATEKRGDIEFLLQLMEQGKLKTVIDKVYSLDDIALAHAHVSGGNKKGNVIIKVG